MTQLEDALRTLRETTTVDYKERLNWGSGRPAQVEVLRDIVGFANRDGGIIVVGVRQVDTVTFELVGLQEDDPMPDSTQIGLMLREHFDPSIEVNAGSDTVDGITYGYVIVPAFSVSPLIATRDVNDPERRRAKLADGDLLIRSDALATEKVKARDLRAMLDRAVTARGRAFATDLPPRLPPPEDDPSWGPASPGTRLLDVRPVPPPPSRRFRELEDIVQDARIVSRYGGVFMPNELDLGAGRVIREAGRIIAQATNRGADDQEETVTTAEITERLAVRIREVPWEGPDELRGPVLDVTSMVLFVLTGTMFVQRLYSNADVEASHLRFGIASPTGVRLVVTPGTFWPLSRAYIATSRTDIWVDREVTLSELATADQRQAFAFDVLEEFFDYFGWRVEKATLEAQVNHIDNRGGIRDA